ncbi:hypothetical protein BGZ98_002101 [Dissophora globulifera]|nr:hypothetical protein BGZ98_002101 [Dissophora globulifera]
MAKKSRQSKKRQERLANPDGQQEPLPSSSFPYLYTQIPRHPLPPRPILQLSGEPQVEFQVQYPSQPHNIGQLPPQVPQPQSQSQTQPPFWSQSAPASGSTTSQAGPSSPARIEAQNNQSSPSSSNAQNPSNVPEAAKISTSLKQTQQPNPPKQSTQSSSPAAAPVVATIFKDFPIKTMCRISKRAAGECIIRASIHVLSRNFRYISKETFLQAYHLLFGAPEKVEGVINILDNKMFRTIIETCIINKVTHYRLSPTFFLGHNINGGKPLAKYAGNPCAGIHPLPLMNVMQAIKYLDTRLISISDNFHYLCPRILSDDVPLEDLRPYLCLWHPLVIWGPELAAFVASNAESVSDMWIVGGTFPVSQYGQLYLQAHKTGMDAKRARVLLEKHANKVLAPVEQERQVVLGRMLYLDGIGASASSVPVDSSTNTKTDDNVIVLDDDDDDDDANDDNKSAGSSSASTVSRTLPSVSINLHDPEARSRTTSSSSEPSANLSHGHSIRSQPNIQALTPAASRSLRQAAATAESKDDVEPMDITEDGEQPTGSSSGFAIRHKGDEVDKMTFSTLHRTTGSPVKRYQVEDTTGADPTKSISVTKESALQVEPTQETGLERQDTGTAESTSQASRLKTMLKQHRFNPYAGAENSAAIGKTVVQRNALSALISGARGTLKPTERKWIGCVAPSSDDIFTLPRPDLPMLGSAAMRLSERAIREANRESRQVMDKKESDPLTAGQLLGRTRDEILTARREALDSIIEYTQKLSALKFGLGAA